MNNVISQALKLVDNSLVPVYETDKGIKVVDGRELHTVLQSKQDFSTWVKKRLAECDAEENKDYSTAPQIYGTANGGHSTRLEYTIILNTAKEMAMLERNEKGKQVRRYFIKVEEKYKQQPQIPMTATEQIKLLAQGNVELNQKVDNLEERFTRFEMDLPLLPDEADEIHDTLNKRVVYLLGGGQSNAYANKSLTRKVFMDAYRELKRNFNVSRYKAIKRNQKERALEIVAQYKPPYFIDEEIRNENAQQKLDV